MPTNREMLEAMSNEDLAKFMYQRHVTCNMCAHADIDCLGCSCVEGYRKWLESEVQE